jgi:hypothetical protein
VGATVDPVKTEAEKARMTTPQKRLGIALGILLIPAVMWGLYGLLLFVDTYLFRL